MTARIVVDPPSGWKYGFPKLYDPLPDESLEAWLVRNGYPQWMIDANEHKHCRWWDFVPDTEDDDESV